MKKLIIFDLDGTLAKSKSPIDAEMGMLLCTLLAMTKVAVISGGDLQQFQQQILAHLPTEANLRQLSLLPTCGTRFFQYADDWHNLYSEDLSETQKQKITLSLNKAITLSGFSARNTWGPVIEDRMSQITYSALGQQAPLEEKSRWDPHFEKRKKIQALLVQDLPDFSVRLGGSTSIDITLPGIDKAYGIRKLREILEISIQDMIYVGDALFPGGNDAPARETGAVCIQVRDPEETKCVIETAVAYLSDAQK